MRSRRRQKIPIKGTGKKRGGQERNASTSRPPQDPVPCGNWGTGKASTEAWRGCGGVGGLSGISLPWQGQACVPRLRDVWSLASPPDDNHTMLLVEVEARMRPARIRTPAKVFLQETSHTDDNDGNRNGLPEASTTRSSTHPPSNSRMEGDVESRRSEPMLRVRGVMPGAQHGTVGRWGPRRCPPVWAYGLGQGLCPWTRGTHRS